MGKNKKATTFQILMMIPRMIFLVIVMFSIIFLINSYIVKSIQIFDAEADLFTLNTFYVVSEVDSNIDRIQTGIINLQDFKSGKIEKKLNQSISYGDDNRKIAANITLKDGNMNEISSFIYNPDRYDGWYTKSKARWNNGPGGVQDKTNNIYVLINNGNTLEEGFLELKIIIPNS
jgi:hypothetical protein